MQRLKKALGKVYDTVTAKGAESGLSELEVLNRDLEAFGVEIVSADAIYSLQTDLRTVETMAQDLLREKRTLHHQLESLKSCLITTDNMVTDRDHLLGAKDAFIAQLGDELSSLRTQNQLLKQCLRTSRLDEALIKADEHRRARRAIFEPFVNAESGIKGHLHPTETLHDNSTATQASAHHLAGDTACGSDIFGF